MDEINKTTQQGNETLNKTELTASPQVQAEPQRQSNPPNLAKTQVNAKENEKKDSKKSEVFKVPFHPARRYNPDIYNISCSDLSKDFKDEDMTQLDKTNLNYTANNMGDNGEFGSEANDMSALERINELVMRSVERTKRTAMYLSGEDNDISLLLNGNRQANGEASALNGKNDNLKGVRRFSASTVKTYSSHIKTPFGQYDNANENELSMVDAENGPGNDTISNQTSNANGNLTSMNASALTTPGRLREDSKFDFGCSPKDSHLNANETSNATSNKDFSVIILNLIFN